MEEELYRWAVMRYGWREEDAEGLLGVKVSKGQGGSGRSKTVGLMFCRELPRSLRLIFVSSVPTPEFS